MSESASAAEKFAEAFNAGDLDALEGLLESNATAEVLGSGFPVEKGAAQIRETSLAYLLKEAETDPLTAEVWKDEETEYVLLREPKGARALDSAIRVISADGKIARLEYLVLFHQLEELKQIGAKLSIQLRSIED